VATTPSPANRIRVGSCRVTLEQARQAGLDGVEIEVGKAATQLRIADHPRMPSSMRGATPLSSASSLACHNPRRLPRAQPGLSCAADFGKVSA
jgi:hypothetical protein